MVTIIPTCSLDDKYKEWATKAEIRESVDSIDDFLRSDQMETSQVILNHFPNFSGNLAIGSNGIAQSMNLEIPKNDFGELKDQLQKLGISKKKLDELHKALIEDGKIVKKPFGNKVSAWIKNVLTSAGSAALRVSESIASDIIVKLFTNYYGL